MQAAGGTASNNYKFMEVVKGERKTECVESQFSAAQGLSHFPSKLPCRW